MIKNVFMKFLLMFSCWQLVYASFGQQKQARNIYDRITDQLCNCINKSKETDSVKRKAQCYELVLKSNYDELKSYGVDTIKNRDFKSYYDVYLKRFVKDSAAAGKSIPLTGDDSFMGSLVKQERLANGQYNIELRSSSDKTERNFISTDPVDKNELKRFLPGEDNIIISYQTINENGRLVYKVKAIAYIGTEKK
jgi:hypothetical protein